MSKIVFVGTPAHGHVNPTLPVVQDLVERGETVVYYNTEEFRAKIERTGAVFRVYETEAISSGKITEALQDGKLANVSGLVLRATDSLLPFLLADLPQQKPDLVIFDSLALWGKMASTILNVRAAGSVSHFIIGVQQIMAENQHSLRYLRQLLPQVPGLLIHRARLSRRYKGAFPQERPLMPVRDGLNIVFTARELQPDNAIVDERFRFVGPSINPQTRNEDFPLDQLQESPVVYISLGTVHQGQIGFYRECFAAFRDYPARFVLSAGRDTDIRALGEIPENFMVRPTVPQLDVLQQTDVFITHGGMNSVQEGLYYGVPLIIVPQQLEQLLNARIIEKHGAGLVLDNPLAGTPVTAADLREALMQVLETASYGEAAGRLQNILQATGGYRQAVDEIQAYVAAATFQN